ncbi:hypothetical protein ACF0H5_002505 [Mactra antiquata]
MCQYYIYTVCLILLLCELCVCESQVHTWYKNTDMVAQETKSSLAKKFSCMENSTVQVDFYTLNVSLNVSARLVENAVIVNLVMSSEDDTWHYMESAGSGPFTDIEITFLLFYKEFVPEGLNRSEPSTIVTEKTSTIMIESSNEIHPSHTPTTSGEILQNSTINSSSDSGVNVTEHTQPEVPDEYCLCPCTCSSPMTQQEFDKMLAEMIVDMQIPKYATSKTKRKLSSATDFRASSTSIGLVGVFVLSAIFSVIVIGDAKLLIRNFKGAVWRVRLRLKGLLRT